MSDEGPRDARDAELLTAYLADRDIPCPVCRYNVRNLDSGRCPECGERLRLRVAPADIRMGAYIATLVACCLGLGGSTLFGCVALAAAPSLWWWREPSAILLVIQWVAGGLSIVPVLAWRRRFWRAPPWIQRTFAVLAWLLFASLSAAVVLTFDN